MYGGKKTGRLFSRDVLMGPALFILFILLFQDFFGFKGAAAWGTTVWMGAWWITRPVNISVTALLPIAVNAMLNLIPMSHVISQYFSEIIVLLFGADLVCLTWSTTGLDKRMSLKALCCIGPSLKQQIAVWLTAATVLSIFLPNVVVCTILVPVAVSMLKFIGEEDIGKSAVAVPILLAIVWGAGIGGFGSPLGGAANLVAISYIENFTGKEFMYVDWLVRFLPILAVIMLLNLLFLFKLPVPAKELKGTRKYFSEIYNKMGLMSYGEKVSFTLFAAATILAFIRPVYADIFPALKPAYVFLIMGFCGFILENGRGKTLISWEIAEKGLMWGMLFLFAGGLALGRLVTETGAAEKMAGLITKLPLTGGVETIFAFVLFSVVLTEISSNTAAAAIAVPVVQSISLSLGLNPIPYLFVSIVAFNSAYMLPVSIRAIPVSYGLKPQALLQNGFMLAVCSTLTITVIGWLLICVFKWGTFFTI